MPPSDTQTSPDAPKKSKMAILQPDIIFEIADILKAVNDDYPKVPVITRLSLINKHWRAHMKLHPLYSTAHFNLSSSLFDSMSKRASFEDVKEWLMDPDRRHRLIHSFSFAFDYDEDYQDFCDLLDNQLSDVKFNNFKLTSWFMFCDNGLYEEDLEFPRSLKAYQLSITNHRLHGDFNWESLNYPLRDNLVSLTVFDEGFDPYNRNLAFKSLKKLHAGLARDSEIYKWNDFLRRHPSISSLSIRYSHKPKKRLPLQIDSLENLETLELTGMTVDLTNQNLHVPLKSLTYTDYRHPITNWTGLSNTLEKLVIGANEEVLRRDHDLLNPEMLYKLDNIKYLDYSDMETSSRFARAFNSGLYDNAMPLIEELYLMSSGISTEALDHFVGKHKRLCRVRML